MAWTTSTESAIPLPFPNPNFHDFTPADAYGGSSGGLTSGLFDTMGGSIWDSISDTFRGISQVGVSFFDGVGAVARAEERASGQHSSIDLQTMLLIGGGILAVVVLLKD